MLPDVYDMTLNADVVVLGGCQTALGKDVRGEVRSASRGRSCMPGPRVVASLWQVDDLCDGGVDEALLPRHVRGSAATGRGAPGGAARTGRQSSMGSPYFWAPFVLQGDWR
jgi:CHAT domain-containing protein